MAYEEAINVLQEGAVMAECGPMRLIISSFIGKVPQREMNVRAAKEAFVYLRRIGELQDRLKRHYSSLPGNLKDPLALEMIQSALAVGDQDLTPMAAVAGTIADAVADFLYHRGMTRVVVNNGGDISVRLSGKETVRVGIREDILSEAFSQVVVLNTERVSWGVATSGLGGRSLTRGIASAATVIAQRASVADAAATAVANASFVAHDKVICRKAETVDPRTDIPELPVTVEVGTLNREIKVIAVSHAMKRARELVERGVILGGFVAVAGETGMTDFFRRCLVD